MFLDIERRHPAVLLFPERFVIHALLWKQNQGPVKPVCVCERSLGPDSAPNRPAIGGGALGSPAAPLAFSGTCSWLQTVAAGMLTWYVDFYRT